MYYILLLILVFVTSIGLVAFFALRQRRWAASLDDFETSGRSSSASSSASTERRVRRDSQPSPRPQTSTNIFSRWLTDSFRLFLREKRGAPGAGGHTFQSEWLQSESESAAGQPGITRDSGSSPAPSTSLGSPRSVDEEWALLVAQYEQRQADKLARLSAMAAKVVQAPHGQGQAEPLPSIATSTATDHIDATFDRMAGESPAVAELRRRVATRTHCVFAKKARLSGAPFAWQADQSVSANVANIAPYLALFAKEGRARKLHGFVIATDSTAAGSGSPHNVNSFSAWLRDCLVSLSAIDPCEEECMADVARVNKRGWRFCFGAEKFFVTCFAPFYGPCSPRHGFGSQHSFILLQPDFSFFDLKVPRDHPAVAPGTGSESVRTVIRRAFAAAGQPYFIPERTFHPLSHLIVPYSDELGEFAAWWEPGDGPVRKIDMARYEKLSISRIK